MEASWDYTKKSGEQVIYGNYSNEITVGGTIGQVATSLTGLDFIGDFRDIYYDLDNYEFTWEHNGQLAMDTIGLLPIVGALKNTDEVGTLIKGAKKTEEVVENRKVIKEILNDNNIYKGLVSKIEYIEAKSFDKIIYRGPIDLAETLKRIKNGDVGTHIYKNDGKVFENWDGILPKKNSGYYYEYWVDPPIETKNNPIRIVIGSKGEAYFTPDHYTNFIKLNK